MSGLTRRKEHRVASEWAQLRASQGSVDEVRFNTHSVSVERFYQDIRREDPFHTDTSSLGDPQQREAHQRELDALDLKVTAQLTSLSQASSRAVSYRNSLPRSNYNSPSTPNSPQDVQSSRTPPLSPLPRYNLPQTSVAQPSPTKSPVDSFFEDSVTGEDSTEHDIPSENYHGDFIDFAAPHAVTTPDDAAHVLRPPPFQMVRTELSRVIEEDEHSEGRRNSTMALNQRSSHNASPLRHKSFPSIRQGAESTREIKASDYRENIQSSPKKQRQSIKILQPAFEDADGDVPVQPRTSRRMTSESVKDLDSNWQDTVEWCYEHEAEADCNFDYTRCISPFSESPSEDMRCAMSDWNLSRALIQRDGEREAEIKAYGSELPGKRSSSVYSSSPPRLASLQTSMPDLDPPSAVSNQSSFEGVSEAVTPEQPVGFGMPRFSAGVKEPRGSKQINRRSPHIFTDTTRQDAYEDLCQENYARDSWQYGRPEGSVISSGSVRSPISKCNSQESFYLRRHRSGGSESSLPDLVHSRHSREKAAEDYPEQLSKHMASLATDDTASRRRSLSSNMVKDVAQKKLFTKLHSGAIIDDATNAQVPLPVHPAFRNDFKDNGGPDGAVRDLRTWVPEQGVSTARGRGG